MAEKWTNTSAPPPSTVMKPKPLSALNHFTVPCAMLNSPSENAGPPNRGSAGPMTVFEQRYREAAFQEDVPSARPRDIYRPTRDGAGVSRSSGSSEPRTQKLATLYPKIGR
ncbi:hypothetical protein Aca07nite_22550 [Actinoplanes capillaceus]|uniref:Uncharacterized protein n=1 Tax=Actinoplanes campanulatus TaxID=113559 RepID=A0ABQ3WFT6_9ACTN|nr:hypothetical protein GCM10010109_00210 [Actinoplanes campanulatus]GID34442.1 hypothetical protein Aca09nite_09480 [Actinoplanes campanulatus]GID44980.1 hypothetical protein Aca07nite_22550 [Actinoplanes capillaceus]